MTGTLQTRARRVSSFMFAVSSARPCASRAWLKKSTCISTTTTAIAIRCSMPVAMSEFAVKTLLDTPIVSVHDVCCQGLCRHKSAEEHTTATHLVFPYRGAYVRHLGQDEAVAE